MNKTTIQSLILVQIIISLILFLALSGTASDNKRTTIAIFDLELETLSNDNYSMGKVISHSINELLRTINEFEVIEPQQTRMINKYFTQSDSNFPSYSMKKRFRMISKDTPIDYIIHGTYGLKDGVWKFKLNLWERANNSNKKKYTYKLKDHSGFFKMKSFFLKKLIEWFVDQNIISEPENIEEEIEYSITDKLHLYSKYVETQIALEEDRYNDALRTIEPAMQGNNDFLAGFQLLAKIHQTMGEYLVAYDKYKDALNCQKKLKKVFTLQERCNVVNTHYLFGGLLKEKALYKKSISEYKKAQDYIKKWKNDNAESNAQKWFNKFPFIHFYLYVADIYRMISDFDQSLEYYSKAKELYENWDMTNAVAEVESNIAYLNIILGNYNQAISNYKSSIKTFKEYKNYIPLLKAYKGLALAYRLIGDTDEALDIIDKPIQIAKKISTNNMLCELYSELGSIFEAKANISRAKNETEKANGFLEEAVKYHEKAVRLAQNIGNTYSYTNAITNLGIVNYTKGNFKYANELILQATKLDKDRGLLRELARDYNNLGLIYTAQGDYVNGNNNYEDARKIRKAIGDKLGLVVTLNSLGISAILSKSDFERADTYFKTSLDILSNINHTEGKARLYKLMGDIYLQKGDQDSALDNYRNAIDLFREIGRASDIKDIQEILDRLKNK